MLRSTVAIFQQRGLYDAYVAALAPVHRPDDRSPRRLVLISRRDTAGASGGAYASRMTSRPTRREVLSATTMLLVVPLAPLACSSSSSSAGSSPGADSGNGCDGIFETSTVTNNHTHTLCVPTADLTNPPAAGKVYTTSLTLGHTHTVTLTQAQLQSIEGGGSVTVTTSGPAAHMFTISKM
jgi:hypothetical protein